MLTDADAAHAIEPAGAPDWVREALRSIPRLPLLALVIAFVIALLLLLLLPLAAGVIAAAAVVAAGVFLHGLLTRWSHEQRAADTVALDAQTPQAIDALRALRGPAWLALGSGAALDAVLAALPADAAAILRRAAVAAASERLAHLAAERGFERIVVAASAMPADLVAAAAAAHQRT